MAHIEDRWYRTVKGPDGKAVKVPRKGKNVRKRKRWRARYLDPDGQEHNRSFATKVLAERFLTEVEHSKNAGTYRDPDAGRVTLRKYAEGWAEGYPTDSTRGEKIRRQLANHIVPMLGGVTLAELERRPSKVQQFLTGLPMGDAGASQIAITLSSIFNAAVADHLISENPCRAKSVRVPRQARRKVVPWTPAQVEDIRAGLPGQYRAAVDCGSGLGERQGEIFAMGPDEIDFLRRKVHVRRQVKRVAGRIWFAAPKGGKDREVPLPEWVSLRLAAHIEAYPPVEVTLPWNEPGNPKRHGRPVTAALLFARDGGPVRQSTFNSTAWTPARNAAGIAEGGMHPLRHLYASALLAGGVDIRALSEYLGHHDPAITLRIYAHLMPSAEGRALRAIEAAFAEARDQGHGPSTAQEGESGRLPAVQRVGPVAAVRHAQDVAQFEPGLPGLVADEVGDGGDQVARAVADHDGHGLSLAGEDGDRVLGDIARGGGVRRVGKVEAEGQVNAPARRAGADHDEALAGDETEQMGNDGENGGRGADAYGLLRAF
jgi:integrase